MKFVKVQDQPAVATPLPTVSSDVESLSILFRPNTFESDTGGPYLVNEGIGFGALASHFTWNNVPGAYIERDIFNIWNLYVPKGIYHAVLEATLWFPSPYDELTHPVGEISYLITLSLDSVPQVSAYPRHQTTHVFTDLGSLHVSDLTSGGLWNDAAIKRVRMSTEVVLAYVNQPDSEDIIAMDPQIFITPNTAKGYDIGGSVGILSASLTMVRLHDLAGVTVTEKVMG